MAYVKFKKSQDGLVKNRMYKLSFDGNKIKLVNPKQRENKIVNLEYLRKVEHEYIPDYDYAM